MMKQYDDFDDALGDALSEFRNAEPRVGLEGRVLAGVGAATRKPKFAWWQWVAVGVAMLVIAIWVARPRQKSEPVVAQRSSPVGVHEEPPKPNIAEESTKVERRRQHVERGRVQREDIKPAVAEKRPFPAPTPMTAEEKALLTLARNNPGVLIETQKAQGSGAIEIRGLTVEPLEGEQR